MSVRQNGEDLSLIGSMLDGSFEALRLNCDTVSTRSALIDSNSDYSPL